MHIIRHLDFHCSVSEKSILKEINKFAYDPQKSSGYHGNLTFHKEPIYKNYEEAYEAIKKLDKGWYDDHAVMYRQDQKVYWLVKVEYHT